MNPLFRFLVGSPIPNDRAGEQRLPKFLALPVFSSDALSSVAYGTQEILLQLSLAGAVGLQFTLPISGAILLVLVFVTLSYRQTIQAYPSGGGSYIVSKENLSVGAGLLAASALLTDYVLTVSVSIAAGVQQITSLFPHLRSHTEVICLIAIAIITLANLRGMKESGLLFALPTYAFIMLMLLLVGSGLVGILFGSPISPPHPPPAAVQSLGWLLILRAFASGCSALTGIEAISNGVQAFRPPESRNAAQTLVVMAALLGVMFVGVSYLTQALGVVYSPTQSQESLLSLLSRTVFEGNSVLRAALLFSTATILVLAANTSFADFPRLSAILARDNFAPRQLTRIGDRLVFSNGILLLGAFSALLILAFNGQTDRLIPLYAVGVFLAFTLSQAGMVRHWLRNRSAGWGWRALANGLGCLATATVLVVIIAEKTTQGAWVVLIIIPTLTWIFRRIREYYLRLDDEQNQARSSRSSNQESFVVLLIAKVNYGALNARDYASRLRGTCRAVHVEVLPEETVELKNAWSRWGGEMPLEILPSPYRSLLEPILNYIRALQKSHPRAEISVVMPELIVQHWWERFLHHNAAMLIRWSLMPFGKVVVVEVPYDPRPNRPNPASQGPNDLDHHDDRNGERSCL